MPPTPFAFARSRGSAPLVRRLILVHGAMDLNRPCLAAVGENTHRPFPTRALPEVHHPVQLVSLMAAGLSCRFLTTNKGLFLFRPCVVIAPNRRGAHPNLIATSLQSAHLFRPPSFLSKRLTVPAGADVYRRLGRPADIPRVEQEFMESIAVVLWCLCARVSYVDNGPTVQASGRVAVKSGP